MESFGSRQSRAASRYGSSPAPAPVFNGPVRKWKKQWVSSHPNGNGKENGRKNAPPLLLCRWTPLPASADEPPKRRLRYAPVVPIEKGPKEDLKKVVGNESEDSKMNMSYGDTKLAGPTGGIFGKLSTGDISGDDEAQQELSEDQSNSNRSPGQGPYIPGSTQNLSNGSGRMLINWED